MNIKRGTISAPCRAVFYGMEGIGKSTFASKCPNPVFIDTEHGTRHLDVARIDGIHGWEHVLSAVESLRKDSMGFETLVIDTVDWLEKWAIESLCATHRKDGIEGFGYGRGFVYVREMFAKLLDALDALQHHGMHVVMTAHSLVKKHEDPGREGAYDRYMLKLSRHLEPVIKEWADLLVFMTYKSIVTEGDKGKVVVGGKERIMHLEHQAAFDAKNRYGLKGTLPLEMEHLAPAFAYKCDAATQKPVVAASVNEVEDDSNSELEATLDPFAEPVVTEPITDVQLQAIKKLYNKNCEFNGWGADKLVKIWQHYELPGPVGAWSKLSKQQAAKVSGFLANKLEQ